MTGPAWRVTVLLTDGRRRSLVIGAASEADAVRRAWRMPRWAVIGVTAVERWVAV